MPVKSLTNYPHGNTPKNALEEECVSRLTFFQAQVLRDTYLEQAAGGSHETDQEIALRTGVALDLVEKFRKCRYKALVRPEIHVDEVVAADTSTWKNLIGPHAYESSDPAVVRRRIPVRPYEHATPDTIL
jgi:hypothetical protein